MANELTDAGEILALDLLAGGAQTITGPLVCRLMTTNGTDATPGTELTGNARANVAVTAAAAGAQSNSGTVSITAAGAGTVTGIEIWDSSGTPKRLWAIALTASKTLAVGDAISFSAGSISLALN